MARGAGSSFSAIDAIRCVSPLCVQFLRWPRLAKTVSCDPRGSARKYPLCGFPKCEYEGATTEREAGIRCLHGHWTFLRLLPSPTPLASAVMNAVFPLTM